jgi:hypothetical protein
MRRDIGWPISLIAVLVAMLVPGGAGAATVVNGGFESGTLAGWHVHRVTGAGNWFAYNGTDAPIGKKRKPKPADPVQAPPEGAFAAISDEANPDTLILYQDIVLEAGHRHQLGLLAYYDSYKPIAVPTPNTLSVDEGSLGGQKNQQYRIDVMKPEAPLESIDPADVLRTLFVTKPGDPQKMAPTRLTAGLGAFAGQTVRLRIANAVREEVFNAGVDAVSISTTPAGQSPSRGSKHGPILFSFGRIRANRRNGTATLRVRVSGSGLVRAKGVSTPAGVAHGSKAGKLRKPVEPVTLPVALAKTVTIHLRPTPSARAILRQQRKLRIKVAVTFMPTGGSPETATAPVGLELAPRPPQRR